MSTEITPGWSGTLTLENMEQVAALMQEVLEGKRFTYIMWYKQPAEKEWSTSFDYSYKIHLTSEVSIARNQLWISDPWRSLHLEEGLLLAFDADGGGFTIEEPWRPERPVFRYQYRVSSNNEEKERTNDYA